MGILIVNKILRNAKYIITTSKVEKDKLNYFGKKEDNAIVLPLPVDYEEGLLGLKQNFLDKYQINNSFVFLFLSRVNYKKGLDLFLLSLAELVREKKINASHIKVVIAGDNNNTYSRYIEKIVEDNRLTEQVIFTGNIVDVEKANAYAAANVFVLPSHNENFGLAIIEALQVGTPILISKNVYIYKELFSDPNCIPGWICKEDQSDLKEQILSCYLEKNKEIYSSNAKAISKQFKSSELISSYKLIFN